MSLPWPNFTTEEWQRKLDALKSGTALADELQPRDAGGQFTVGGTDGAAIPEEKPEAELTERTVGWAFAEYEFGGPGSGNFGHEGRPGEVGGSAAGDGGGGGSSQYASSPRVFNTPDEVVKDTSWGETSWRWKNEDGSPSGRLLTGHPIPHDELPDVLLHVTTNGPAVMSSGVLLGQRSASGLGGGQADGVSFTTSETDARVIQRELTRAIRIARGEDTIDDLQRYAREDEEAAGMKPGALDGSVRAAQDMWDGNKFHLDKTFIWDKDAEGGKGGWVGPPPSKEERERRARSLMKDTFNAYLNNRGWDHRDVEILKNPILFGNQDKLKKLDPKNVQILKVSKKNIPKKALVTSGSDEFLHEVRVYGDVPVHHAA